MAAPSLIQLKPQAGNATPFFQKRADTPLVNVDPKGQRRSKVWDISPALHCSIIGTCLTAAELRQFFVKLGDPEAQSASDHTLHSRGVRAAGQHDLVGKLLHKMLDNQHETAVKRFARALTTKDVREQWTQAFEQGGIPGAYWAVLTHPATDRPLVEEVFGQVHMLSHMVGSSNRMDITRLRNLERELGERDGKIARQEARLASGAADRSALLLKIERLEADLRHRAAAEQAPSQSTPAQADTAALLQRIDAEKAHGATLAARVEKLETELQGARKFAATLHKQNNQLGTELIALEAELKIDAAHRADPAATADDLRGRTLLYVGGRPGLLDQLKPLCARRGGELVSHDGGIEENFAMLPGLISRAETVFFPVDCVSHAAVGQIKKLCRDMGKPFVPLRSASMASFIAAMGANEASHNAGIRTK